MSVLSLDEKEIDVLASLANQLTECPSGEPELFCKKSNKLSPQIPERIQSILTNFAEHGSDTGFLLVKTIPVDEIPKTPPGNKYKVGETTTLAKIQSLFIHVICEMIAYEAEGYGRLFQDVVPIQSMAAIQTSLGSNTELEIHTEQAFSNLKPDILSLSCLRGDEAAFTYILPVQSILHNMSSHEIELLEKPLWKTGVDLSFKLHGNEFIDGDIRGPMPILQRNSRGYTLVFDQDLMYGITQESDELLQKIIEIYYTHRLRHSLTPGEIIFIDNHRAVHGRSPFFPKYDGYDRFLVRCFGTYDYEKSNYARIGRMVLAIYS